MRPLASVLVPFRQSAAHIAQCMNAVLAQTLPRDSFEVIAIDNGSTDGSRQAVEQCEGVRLVDEPRRGAYVARNRGAAAARGEYLVFTDADCAPDSGWLSRHVEALADPEVHVVLGSRRPGAESTPLRLMMLYEETKAARIFGGPDAGLFYGYTNNMSVRSATWHACGGFRPVQRGGDSIFVQQVVSRYGLTSVRYRRDAIVTHLEITSLRRWYAKHAIYGRSNQRNALATRTVRPMSMAQRWRAFRAAVDEHHLAAGEAVWLLGILSCGGLGYELGRLVGRLGPVPLTGRSA